MRPGSASTRSSRPVEGVRSRYRVAALMGREAYRVSRSSGVAGRARPARPRAGGRRGCTQVLPSRPSPRIASPTMRAALIATIVVGVPVLLTGCGASDDPKNDNQVAGKVAFVKNCGSCHVLGRAGTKGTTGPNLDQAFQQAVKDGFGRDAIRGLVQQQILYPNKTGVMPAKLVEGETASDVASYVADAVSEKGKDTGLLADAVKPAGAGKPIAAVNGVLATEADPNGQLAYVASKATAPPGTLNVT